MTPKVSCYSKCQIFLSSRPGGVFFVSHSFTFRGGNRCNSEKINLKEHAGGEGDRSSAMGAAHSCLSYLFLSLEELVHLP